MKSTKINSALEKNDLYKSILNLVNRDTFFDVNESSYSGPDYIEREIRMKYKNRRKLLLSRVAPTNIQFKFDIILFLELFYLSGDQGYRGNDVFLYFNQYSGETYLSNKFNYRFDELQDDGIPILNLSQELNNDMDSENIPETFKIDFVIKRKLFSRRDFRMDVKPKLDEFGIFLNQYIKNKLVENLPTFAYDPSKYFDESVGKYNFPFLGLKTVTDEEFRSFWNPRDLISLSRENLLLCYNSIRPNILPKLIKEHYFLMKSFNDQDNTFLANDRFAPLRLSETKKVLEDYYENNEYVRSIIDNFNIYYLNLFTKDPKMLDKVGCNNALSSFQAIMSELVKVEALKFSLNDDLFKVLLSSSRSVFDLRYLCDYINETETILNDIKLDTKVNIYIESYNSQKSKNELILLELLKKSNPNISDIIKNNIRIVYKDYNHKIFLPQLDKDSFLVLKKMTEKYGIETNLSPELISELSKYLN